MESLLLKMNDVATLLAVSRAQAYVLAASGQLPGVVRIGTSVRVSRRALEAWIAAQENGSSEFVVTPRRRAS